MPSIRPSIRPVLDSFTFSLFFSSSLLLLFFSHLTESHHFTRSSPHHLFLKRKSQSSFRILIHSPLRQHSARLALSHIGKIPLSFIDLIFRAKGQLTFTFGACETAFILTYYHITALMSRGLSMPINPTLTAWRTTQLTRQTNQILRRDACQSYKEGDGKGYYCRGYFTPKSTHLLP